MPATRLKSLSLAACVICAAHARADEATADSVAAPHADADLTLNEVVVTGTRAPKLLKDTPVQTMLITAKDIAKADATDIEDILQQEIPGVEFSYAMNQQVHLNFGGFGGQGVLFLVDGERLAGETMDDVDFNRINMAGVERIEIVRGAASALYGSNAGGGVINVITRRARKPWDLNVNARIGRHLEQRYGITLGNRHKSVSNLLTTSYNSVKNYDVHSAPDPATRVVATIYGNRTFNVKDQFTVTPLEGLRLTARAGFFFRQLARVHDTPERYRGYSGGLRGSWAFGSGNDLHVAYSFDQYDKSDFHRISGLDVRSYSNVQNSVRAVFSHTFGRGDVLTAGADFLHDYLHNDKITGGRRTQDNADAFVQYDWIADDRWEAVAALRYDWLSEGNVSRATPKVSVRYRPVGGLNLRFSYGMGFRAATLKEKYYDFDMAGIWIVKGNPSLKPESSHNVNISADYTRRSCNFTLTAFYNRVKDKITTGLPYALPSDPSQLYLDYVNLDGYSVLGGEAAVQAAWSCGLSAKVAYSFTHERTARDKDGKRANNQYMPARPHSLTARAGWTREFSDAYTFSAGVNGRVLSGVDNEEYRDYYDISAGTVKVHYPAYTIWKLSCTQTFFGRVKLTLALDNVFNYRPKHYYLNSPLTDGINFQAGVSIDLD